MMCAALITGSGGNFSASGFRTKSCSLGTPQTADNVYKRRSRPLPTLGGGAFCKWNFLFFISLTNTLLCLVRANEKKGLECLSPGISCLWIVNMTERNTVFQGDR